MRQPPIFPQCGILSCETCRLAIGSWHAGIDVIEGHHSDWNGCVFVNDERFRQQDICRRKSGAHQAVLPTDAAPSEFATLRERQEMIWWDASSPIHSLRIDYRQVGSVEGSRSHRAMAARSGGGNCREKLPICLLLRQGSVGTQPLAKFTTGSCFAGNRQGNSMHGKDSCTLGQRTHDKFRVSGNDD